MPISREIVARLLRKRRPLPRAGLRACGARYVFGSDPVRSTHVTDAVFRYASAVYREDAAY